MHLKNDRFIRQKSQSAYNILKISHDTPKGIKVKGIKPKHCQRKRSISTFSSRSSKIIQKRETQHPEFSQLTHFFKQNKKLLLTSPVDTQQQRSKRLRSSSFSAKVALYNRNREFFLLNKLQNEPVNIQQKMDQSVVKFRIIKNAGMMNLRALKDWINEYNTDKKSFRSIERFAVIKLNELNTTNQGKLKGMKNRLKTAVCCDLIQDLMHLYMNTINDQFKQQIITQIFKAIYCDINEDIIWLYKYDIDQLVRCMPYFMLSRKMVKKLQKTEINNDEAESNMRLLRGAINIKEKIKIFTESKKQEAISINRLFIEWREHSKLIQDRIKKAEKILRKYALIISKKSKLTMFANWKKGVVMMKRRRQQRQYDRLLNELQKQRAQLESLMNEKYKTKQIKNKLLKDINEQELENKLGLFVSPEKIKAQQEFERQLEILNGMKTEFMKLPGTINYVGSLIDNNEDLTKLFDEEIVLKWLKYQLKLILNTVQRDYNLMKEKMYISNRPNAKSLKAVKKLLSSESRLNGSNSFAISLNDSQSFIMAIESDEDIPEISNKDDNDDKNVELSDFHRLKIIIQNVIQCGLNDFGQDFQGGKIWLILFYFLFDGANFDSLKELLQLIKYSHVKHQRYHLVVDKIITLYRQYLDINNKFDCFVNDGSLVSNLNIMNFSLLLQFIQTKPNIIMTADDINKDKMEIETAIHLVSTIMGQLSFQVGAPLFRKEAKSIQNKIKIFRHRKKQLIKQHRKWSEIQKRFDLRLFKELYDFKAGKLNFLYEPTYPRYIIKNIANIPFYTVQSIYCRYFNDEEKMRDDYQSTLININKGMGIIYALLKRYTTQNGSKLSFVKYNKMIFDCKLFIQRDPYALKCLFGEIWQATKNINETQQFHLNCYQNFVKSIESIFDRKTVELMSLNAQKFGLLLVYIAEMIFFHHPNMTPSVKVNILLQQHLLKIVYPKSDIIAFCHLNMIRLLQKRKSQQLNAIWYICKEIDKKRTLSEDCTPDTITIDAIIQLLSTHVKNAPYHILHQLCQTIASYQDNSRMDVEELFGIICHIGHKMVSHKIIGSHQGIDIHTKIASFIDKLSSS